MPSARPTPQPSFNAKLHEQRLYERVRQGYGTVELPPEPSGTFDVVNEADPHAVFNPLKPDGTPANFALWKQWAAKQIHDVMMNHAEYIDFLDIRLANVAQRESNHFTEVQSRLAAIEAQLASTPFPG